MPVDDVYTDETIIPFGIHKGKTLANVPASYLLWWFDEQKKTINGYSNRALTKYINDNYELLKKGI